MVYDGSGGFIDEGAQEGLVKSRIIRKPAFFLLLALFASTFLVAEEIPCIWGNVRRIVAVGDLHGDYDAFISIISDPEVGLVDKELNWIGGDTHFVQTGDVMDRGLQARDILDVLIRLEKEATEAGGMVHFLLGNHEEMNITGISLDYPDYVYAKQFVDFLPENYKEAKNKEFLATLPPSEREWIESHGMDYAPFSKAAIFWDKVKIDRGREGDEARAAYRNFFVETYGPWLLRKNIVIKINSMIFAHGGINEKYSRWAISAINDSYRKELDRMVQLRLGQSRSAPMNFRPEMVYQPDSPLWFRGLADGHENERAVYAILDNLGARFIVVGHTVIRNGGRSPVISPESMSRFEGRVWTIDTGISSYYGGAPSALIYDDGIISVWPRDIPEQPATGKIKPRQEERSNPEEIEAYLRTAAITDRREGRSGRTDPWTVTLDDGKTVRRAMFKYIDRRRPDPQLLPSSYRYELAAYALNRHLGLDSIPAVVEREIENIPGALQVFVENAVRESDRREKGPEPSDPEAFLTAMQVIKIFDNLVYNSCADADDIYVGKETWKIQRVDFNGAFDTFKELVAGCDFSRCTRALFQKLIDWDDKKVTDIMAPFLNPEEIKALSVRKNLILQKIQQLIKDKGEKAVLFE